MTKRRRTPMFKRSEPKREYRYFLTDDLSKCTKIDGAKVCEFGRKGGVQVRDKHPYGQGRLKMLYCEHAPTDYSTSDYHGRERCRVESLVDFFGDREAYIHWYGAEPRGEGHGSRRFNELEKWLQNKRCIKRLTLHAANENAEAFWEKMGFRPLADIDYDAEYGDPVLSNFRYRSGDNVWKYEYSDLRPYELMLHPPKRCAELVRRGRQTHFD